MIDFLAPLEGHYLKNQLYRSVLRKNTLLLMFTILIVPTIALSTASDLLHYIRKAVHPEDTCAVDYDGSGFSWLRDLNKPIAWASDSFGQAFLENNGPFFILFMLQAWVLGTAAALCLMPYMGWTCCNATLPKFVLGQFPGQRILWEFPLEYNYALNSTIYAVVLTYSVAFPSVIPIGLCFGVCRYATDKYTLLFAHQGNLDRHFAEEDDEEGTEKRRRSEVLVCTTVGNSMIFAVVLFDVAMVGFFHRKDLRLMAMTIVLTFIFIAVQTREGCCARVNASESDKDGVSIEKRSMDSGGAESPGRGSVNNSPVAGGSGRLRRTG